MAAAGKILKATLKLVQLAIQLCIIFPIILFTAALVALAIPSVQQKTASLAAGILSDRTGMQCSVGHFSIRPPLDILIEDVYALSEEGDTLVCAGRIDARIKIRSIPDSIAVKSLSLKGVTAHTGDFIQGVRIDGKIGSLKARTEALGLKNGIYRIEGGILCDSDIKVTLAENDVAEEDEADSSYVLEFDLVDMELRNLKFALDPQDINLSIDKARTSALLDIDRNCYTAREFEADRLSFSAGTFRIPAGNVRGSAVADIGGSMITTDRFIIEVPEWNAEATITNSSLDLSTMTVSSEAEGRYSGYPLKVTGSYNIENEEYRAESVIGRTDLAEILGIPGEEIILQGHIRAEGKGFSPETDNMKAHVTAEMDSCRFNGLQTKGLYLDADIRDDSAEGTISANLCYSDTTITAGTDIRGTFVIDSFLDRYPSAGISAKMKSLTAEMREDSLSIDEMDIRLKTADNSFGAELVSGGMDISLEILRHALELPGIISELSKKITIRSFATDSLRKSLPGLKASVRIEGRNPIRDILVSKGFDIGELTAELVSDSERTKFDADVSVPDINGEYRLPSFYLGLSSELSETVSRTDVRFKSDVRDGLMSVHGMDADLDMNATLSGNDEELFIDGMLDIGNLIYEGKNIGNRSIDFGMKPDEGKQWKYTAYAKLDDIPVDLLNQFVRIPDELGIKGSIRARAELRGLPDSISVFAGITPVDVSAAIIPLDAEFRLENKEITLKDGTVSINGIALSGADSTFLYLDGNLNLNESYADLSLKSDAFEPASLPKGGKAGIYGKLMFGLDGRMTGPLDSLDIHCGIRILPKTDITYPIDKKNLVQILPSGTVDVSWNPKDSLRLHGRIDVNDGKIFYTPALYPMPPFKIDRGSSIKFNGKVMQTELALSASQNVRSSYRPKGGVSRRVDFITGVKLNGTLEKPDIGFYLNTPNDKEIQNELENTPDEDREGLGAVLLATGMYASESNDEVQQEGYAISSIMQSRINAINTNRLGKFVDVDFGIGKGKHGNGIETTDYSVNLSKSLFNDRVKVKLGGTVTDNAEVNRNSLSILNNISAEYSVDTTGMYKFRIFSMRDYDNVIEGELGKSGGGFLMNRTLKKERDSLDRSVELNAEGNIVYRTNNQLGPNASVSVSKHNLFSRNETLTARLKGAYYWDLNKRKEKDPRRNDTYTLGGDIYLDFPYYQLAGRSEKNEGHSKYFAGYLNENISGKFNINKYYLGTEYDICQNKYITHTFSPFTISLVLADKLSAEAMQDMNYEELLKLYIDNEFYPSTKYSFNYNNFRDKDRVINTGIDFQIKEASNLVSGIMTAFGRDFNEVGKKLCGISYDQFVKLQLEARNRFHLGERIVMATRAFAGAAVTYGNSLGSPMSEAYSIGGPNSLRAFAPRSIGPGDFYNRNYSSYIFHTGDMKLEMNAELRFPIVWKINGAVFVDAGNIWDLRDIKDILSPEQIEEYIRYFNLPYIYNSGIKAETFFRQIALGSGLGLRLDYNSIVIRLDLGIAIHAPYDTGRGGYYNIPNMWRDGMRLNFGIGYPF